MSISLPQFIEQIRTEVTWQNSDRNAITIYKRNGLRMVLIALHEYAILKEHTADGIISVQVLEGSIIFSMGDESVEMKKGQLVALHAGLANSVKAIEESVFLLTLTTTLEP